MNLTITLDHFRGDSAVFTSSSRWSCELPRSILHADAKEGETIQVNITHSFFSSPSINPQDVVDEMNRYRKGFSLAPLTLDPKLSETSEGWAKILASRMMLTHGDYIGRIESVYPNVPFSEDLAEGTTSVNAVVQMLMSDPPHRRNIMGEYNKVGVGSAVGNDVIFWCVDFALIEEKGEENTNAS